MGFGPWGALLAHEKLAGCDFWDKNFLIFKWSAQSACHYRVFLGIQPIRINSKN
jgi:hypothetical protein